MAGHERAARTSTSRSALLWLEADTLIRSKSGGAKSLDDFCKLFHGAPSTAPKVVPYDFNDVVKALNAVLPYDWRGFWTERLNRLRARGAARGPQSQRLALELRDRADARSKKALEAIQKKTNLQYSLGFDLRDDGAVITNIVPGSPADVAGIAPGSQLIAVDGRKYSKEVLQDTLNAGGADIRVDQVPDREGRHVQRGRVALRRQSALPAAGARGVGA